MAKPKQTPASKISFGDAVTEVEQILARLEQGEIDIDELSDEVKRAVELIQVCREKLQRTEREVGVLVDGLQADTDTPVDDDTAESGTTEDLPF